MNNEQIIFDKPWEVNVKQVDISSEQPAAGFALVKKLYTLISPGTELACLSGGEAWFSLPGLPGYAAISEVVAIGENESGIEGGDRVFHYGKHARYEVVPTTGVFLKVPHNLESKLAPFARMVTVAMTALRVSEIQLGDKVAVTGVGLIGNMAAQLAALQGAEVIGIDLSEERLNLLTKTCDRALALNGNSQDLSQLISEATGGVGVSTMIEATGVPKVAVDSLPWIAPYGELILLGSPRGEYQTNITDVFNYNHLIGRGCITFKGAHEWRLPVEPNKFVKHSLVRNTHVAFNLIASGKLNISPLISHILKPEQAQEAYIGLRDDKDKYSGVLFDWS